MNFPFREHSSEAERAYHSPRNARNAGPLEEQVTPDHDPFSSRPPVAQQVHPPRMKGVSAWLFAVGLPLLLIGAFDASTAPTFTYRVLGLLIGMAGILSMTAVYGLFWRSNWVWEMGLAASFAGISVGIFLFFYQLNYGMNIQVFAWTAIAIGSLVCYYAIGRARKRYLGQGLGQQMKASPNRRLSGGEKASRGLIPTLTSLGITATLVWGFMQFWYTNQYAPGQLGAALTLSSTVSEAGMFGGLRGHVVEIKARNGSNLRIQVVSSLYKVTQSKIDASERTDESFFGSFVKPPISPGDPPTDTDPVNRHGVEGPRRVLAFGRFIPDNWYFEPQEEYTARVMVYSPKEAENLLRLSLDVWVAKGDRLRLTALPRKGPLLVKYGPPTADHQGIYAVVERPIERLSLLRRIITRGDQSLYVLTKSAGTPKRGD